MPDGYYGLLCMHNKGGKLAALQFFELPASPQGSGRARVKPGRSRGGGIRSARPDSVTDCSTEGARAHTAKVKFFTGRGARIFAIMPGFGSAATLGGGAGRPSLSRPLVRGWGWCKESGGPARRKRVGMLGKGGGSGPTIRFTRLLPRSELLCKQCGAPS
jgi:hypothetical protein